MISNDLPPILIFRTCICGILTRKKSIWSGLPAAKPDEILGIKEEFEKSKSGKKFDLTMAITRDRSGRILMQKCVKKAERILASMHLHKHYLPALGSPIYRKLAPEVTFGKDCEQLKNGLNVTSQGLARTGSLKIAMNFIYRHYPGTKVVYLPIPAWPNYKRVIENSLIETKGYKYYNYRENIIDFSGMFQNIKAMPDGAIILFTTCGHNPTGLDPSISEWNEISSAVKAKNLLAILDLNSQGVSSGDMEVDAYALKKFLQDGNKVVAVQSFSKCMCLYGERIGACTFLAESKEEAERIESQMKIIIRTLYSNPPLHGQRIVVKILEDVGLQTEWKAECKDMANRLKEVRKVLVDKLYKQGSIRNWEHIVRQQGSFGFLGLNAVQIKKLRYDYNLYLTGNGRIAMGSVNMKNVDYIAYALHFVTK